MTGAETLKDDQKIIEYKRNHERDRRSENYNVTRSAVCRINKIYGPFILKVVHVHFLLFRET